MAGASGVLFSISGAGGGGGGGPGGGGGEVGGDEATALDPAAYKRKVIHAEYLA